MCVLCLYSSLARFLLYSHCVCVGANCPKLYPLLLVFVRAVRIDCLVPTPGYLNPHLPFVLSCSARRWLLKRVGRNNGRVTVFLSLMAMFNKLILLNTIYIYIYMNNLVGDENKQRQTSSVAFVTIPKSSHNSVDKSVGLTKPERVSLFCLYSGKFETEVV